MSSCSPRRASPPAGIPFTYTVAWYEGTRDNIKKEVVLPGLYEDVRVDDLKHDFTEARLD